MGILKLTKMEPQVRFSPRKRALEHLRDGIANGVYPVGRRLPSERDLAESIGVARPTVRKVLSMLDEEGVIHSNGAKLRLVSEQADNSRRISAPRLMKNTLVLVSLNPEGLPAHHREHGWSDWLDRGIVVEARKQHLHLFSVACSRLGGADWESIIQAGPVGVIVTDLLNSWTEIMGQISDWKREELAVVAYGNYPELCSCDRVSSDHELGGYLVTKAFLETGRKNILMMAPLSADIYWFVERYAGYQRACHEHQVAALPFLSVPNTPDLDDFKAQYELEYRHLAGYLAPVLQASKVDAIIAVSDGKVPHTTTACRVLGKVPGRDVVIAGYDDYWAEIPERALEKEPPLFSVDKRNSVIGAELVRLLNDRVAGHLPAEAQKRLVKPVLRRKTALRATRPP